MTGKKPERRAVAQVLAVASADGMAAETDIARLLKYAPKNLFGRDALDHLTLARAALLAGILADEAAARRHATAAVDGLRAAGTMDHLPRCPLTRAWLSAVEARRGLEPAIPAADDLDQAERIAGRGGMKLYLADIHLHRAGVFGDRDALAQARALIDECG